MYDGKECLRRNVGQINVDVGAIKLKNIGEAGSFAGVRTEIADRLGGSSPMKRLRMALIESIAYIPNWP